MALERFDPQTQLSNVKKVFSGVTEVPKLVEQPPRDTAVRSVYPIDKSVIQQRRREMTPAKTDDPGIQFLNAQAPEGFMVDIDKGKKIIAFTQSKHPELEGEELIKKATEYLPVWKQYEDEQRVAKQPKPTQELPMQGGIRRGVAGNASLEGTMLEGLEPVNKQLDKANLVGRFTQFIDESAQKIPAISRESMANALKGTPFEGMEVLPTMVANAPGSLVKTATATARGITNPFDTIIGLSKLVMTPEGRQAVVDRYGSIEGLKKTMTEDPVGLASDALTLVQGGANIASKGASLAGMTDTASKLSNISNVAGGAADLGLSTVIPQGLQKASQFGNEMGQKGLLGNVGNTVIKGLVEPTQPLQMAKDIYGKVQEVKPIETIARKILGATDEQSKLFKAQEARTGQLNKSVDWKNLRKQSDIANEEIVRYGYKPTDTATRAEAHANTMQKIWDNEIKARNGNEFDIDLNNVADKIDEFVAKQTDAGLVKNKAQLAELQAQSKAFREMGTVDGAKGEFIKEMINAQIDNWGDASIGDVYKNGMKEATRQLGANLDEAFSRIPGEFADAKKRFGALKATYADVVKADIKAQKAKGDGLTETFSRIEGFGDILAGVGSMFGGKNPLPQLASGLGKLAVGRVLQKIKDKDFLIQEGFEGLSKKAGKVAPVIKASTNRKALPLIEGSMEFQTPTARIGNTQPRGVDITETGMENVRQPQTTKTDPLVKSIAQPVDKSLDVLKKLEADTTLEKVPQTYLQQGKGRVIETKYGTVTEMIKDNRANVVKVKVGDKVYDANNLDFFEKKKVLENTPLVKGIDNEQSLNNMVKKGQRQSIVVEEGLKELGVKLDDLDAAQLKQFGELVRARNFDDARQAKWDNLKKEVSKKKVIVKADTPTISPKAKKPLIKAEVASKVDDALPVGEKMGNTTQKAKSLDKIDDGLIAEARKYESADEFRKGISEFEFNGNTTKRIREKPTGPEIAKGGKRLWGQDQINDRFSGTKVKTTPPKSPQEAITIYRVTNKKGRDFILPNDFVTTSKEGAQEFLKRYGDDAKNFKVLTKDVTIEDLRPVGQKIEVPQFTYFPKDGFDIKKIREQAQK